MKREDLSQILQAYDEAAQLMGFETFPAFLSYVCKESQKQIDQVRHARTRKGLETWLSKQPDMSTDQLKATLEGIRLIPRTLRGVLPKAAKEAAQKLPHDPGGHPKSVQDGQWPTIYERILESIKNGKSESAALQIAAKENGVSLRTIQRGWKRRGDL